MATSQEQLSSSDLERDGVKYSGYTDTSSSVHGVIKFLLARHPSYPKAYIVPIDDEFDFMCHFVWSPPHVGCTCQDHSSSVHCKSQYYALEYQIQHIEIDHRDSQMTVKNVYFGPLNKCTLILDNWKEHLFRVRCTNDGVNFGHYSGVFPLTYSREDFEYLPPNVYNEHTEDNGKGSPPKPEDDVKRSPPKDTDGISTDEDDTENNKRKTSARSNSSVTDELAQHQPSNLLTKMISVISTDPFTWSPKNMIFALSKDYKPDLQLAQECPKAIFASIDDSVTDKSSEAEHDDTIIPSEAEETLKEVDDPHIQSILDDANKQKDNQPQEEQFSSTSSSFHDLPICISSYTSVHRSTPSSIVSTLMACSWSFTIPYYEEYRSILTKQIDSYW